MSEENAPRTSIRIINKKKGGSNTGLGKEKASCLARKKGATTKKNDRNWERDRPFPVNQGGTGKKKKTSREMLIRSGHRKDSNNNKGGGKRSRGLPTKGGNVLSLRKGTGKLVGISKSPLRVF